MDSTDVNTNNKSESGLTTKEALHQLHDDIEKVLNEYQSKQNSSTSKSWLRDTFHHQSKYTTLNWITLTAILLSSIILITSYILLETSCQVLIYAAVIILLLMSLNTYLVISNNKLRYNEIPHRVSAILATLKLAIVNVKWLPENYPQLCSPYSPCVTMQWTYRDGAIVNLPWSLLVKGDIIIIRPGQVSPGLCKALDEDSECPILKSKEIYGPVVASVNEVFTVPKARDPLKNKKYCLMETPFLSNLEIALERGLDRPVSYYDQQRYLLVNVCLERFTYPLILIFAIFFNFLRYIYLYTYVGRSNWIEMFFLQPTVTALPLLPLLFPIIWLTLNALGLARFKALFNETSKVPLVEKPEPFAEADSSKDSEPVFNYHLSEVWNIFLDIFTGRELMMCRSANILHVFGSLTALCVIDKKGILSWPNPTAEKVFFLRSSENLSPSSSLDSMADSNADADSIRTGPKQTGVTATKGTVTEVLDLTHGHNVPFQLEFDDHEWKAHLSNLKPLGLAILLNTCNLDTHEHYSQFCSHVTCEAMYNENLIPVTNRRCLCELAKQIGFVDQAKDIFRIEEQLSTYRHLQTDYVRRDKFARSLHLHTKLKFPFPHMMAVVMKELTSGSLQLLSQGTADIILDSCVDYWDGKDLCPLSPSDRKKVTDFYQRTSLTAYCTAFAYRPLTRRIDNRISKIYMELPSDCKHLYMPYRSPTPLQWDFKNILEPRFRGGLGQFHSTDSLLYNDPKEDAVADIEGCFETQCNQVFIGMVTMQYQAQSDMVHLIERLERACVRFVHFSKENELRSRVFSEKMGLESGWNCHISLLSERPKSDNAPSECWANNGTTRVCSPSSMPHRVVTRHSESDKQCNNETEKLLPSSNLESAKPRSLSAPSAINLDYSVVKFDEDPLEYGDGNGPVSDWSTGAVMGGGDKSEVTRDLTTGKDDGSDLSGSRDSVMVQSIDLSSHQEGWQSLSCLTDSTEQSAPVNFDMSNRAKLPRGIENIRPHLEEVDNVPLLVSLFTDCTVVVTHRMLRIMQDYGQTICVLGSASNAENIDLFMQGDASIAVEPLYPQVCQRVPVFAPVEPVFGPSPVTLSRTLNALPCSLAFKREDPVSIYHLMLEARHYMLAVSNCIQFWVCCVVTLSFLQLVGIILMLPPLLTIGQVMWLVCVVFPVLSFSLVGLPVDSQVMQKPSSKYQYTLNTDIALFVSWCYCAKFLPMAFIILLCYVCTLIGFCHDIEATSNTTSCVVLYPYSDGNESMWMGWTVYSYSLLVAQHVVVLLIVLHLLTISVCFVHREYSIWQQSPLTNKLWIFSVIIIFALQLLFTSMVLSVSDNYKDLAPIFIDLPWPVMVFGILSPVLSFCIVEFIKWQEIKVNLRYQRRARLDFGTKLGMNSPF